MKYIIVGFGNIGHKRQKALGKKFLVSVDIDPGKKPDFLDSSLVPVELLKKFQAVIVSTSQPAKLEVVKYWLNQGKHVLVEKPLIITPEDGKELNLLAQKNNVIWYTSYNHRFEPNIIKIKKLLDKNTIGSLYYARFIYSFGNIRERLGTWRDTEYGVLEEIAPHPIDFAKFFFNYQGKDFAPLIAQKLDSPIFDHWIFSTQDQKIIIETSSIIWKNIFSIDLYGEKGSIHMESLRKWGGSHLIVRKRVYPAGIPIENKSFDEGSDITWQKDIAHFEKLARGNTTSLESDLSISQALANIALAAKPTNKNSQQSIYRKISNGK